MTEFRKNLPDYTIQALKNPNSPQTRAYDWVRIINARVDYQLSMPRQVQRFALLTFFYATGGETKWKKNEVVDDWLRTLTQDEVNVKQLYRRSKQCPRMGTVCNDHDEIVDLKLHRNGLVGSIPKEISLLTSLTRLSLRQNTIRGNVPSQLGLLSDLQVLNLSENQIIGTIPKEIGQLRNLTYLAIDRNHFEGPIPSEMGWLKQLEIFWFCSNAHVNGTMPEEVCNLLQSASLQQVEARCRHCANFECSCCEVGSCIHD